MYEIASFRVLRHVITIVSTPFGCQDLFMRESACSGEFGVAEWTTACPAIIFPATLISRQPPAASIGGVIRRHGRSGGVLGDSAPSTIAGPLLEHMPSNQIVDVVADFRLKVGSEASYRVVPIPELPFLLFKEELGGPHPEDLRDLPENGGGGELDAALDLADVVRRQIALFGHPCLGKTEACASAAQIQRQERLDFRHFSL